MNQIIMIFFLKLLNNRVILKELTSIFIIYAFITTFIHQLTIYLHFTILIGIIRIVRIISLNITNPTLATFISSRDSTN